MQVIRLSAIAILGVCSLGLTAGHANEIGAVAAVNKLVDGKPPDANLRVLELSDRLFQDELIRSSEAGNAQFLFEDQTSLTIAPRTEIVLDQYVYDPVTERGEMTLNMTRGLLRFVGGRISKNTDVQVVTPTATIGIRGGLVIIEYRNGVLKVVHAAGEYTKIEGAGEQLTLSRPSAWAEMMDGMAPEYKGIVSDDDVQRFYASLRGPGGGGTRTSQRIAAAFTRTGNNETVGDTASGSPGSGGATVPAGSELAIEASDGETPFLAALSTAGEEPAERADFELLEIGFAGDIEFQNLGLRDIGGIVDSPGFQDVGGAGFIRGQLVWTNNADLDLHLILPDGAGQVAFFNTIVEFNNGGAIANLDADNLGGVINVQPDLRVENITVTGADVPAGDYTFFVDNFSSRGNAETPFDLSITTDGGQTFVTESGVLGPNEFTQDIVVQSEGGSFTGDGLSDR